MGWTLQDWAALATIISTIWFVGTTVFVWNQLRLQRTSADTDKRRFLRETITFIHDTLQNDDFRRARSQFFAGSASDYAVLDDENKGWARSILATYGLLARMVDHGAVEEALVKDYWRSALARDWERLRDFVEGERRRSRNPALFSAAESLAERWKGADA